MDSQEEITGQIITTLTTKTGYLDVFAVISIAESAHLSHIARLIGKSKSTILKTIDSMMAESTPLIEVDEERTIHTRGVKKFYRLTEIGQRVDLMIEKQVMEENVDPNQIQMVDDEQIYRSMIRQEAIKNLETYGENNMMIYFTLGSELNYYFQRTSAHAYIEMVRKLRVKPDDDSQVDIPYGTFFSSLKRVKVSDFIQVQKIRSLTMKYLQDLNHLEEEINRQNTAKIEEGKLREEDLDSQIIFVNLNPVSKDSS